MVRPGGACAGQTERRCAVTGTGKSLSHPLAGDRAEVSGVMKLFNRCGWQSLSLVPPCPISIR